MKFDVLTLFPEMFAQAFNYSILKRATENGLISLNLVNPRDFTLDKHKKVDDTPFGGGAGMVLMCQPFIDAYNSLDFDCDYEAVILSPQGEKFNQSIAKELSEREKIIFICGHYEGFDERIKKITKARELSIGDFVLTGGEYPALCMIDAISRLIEGVLGDDTSSVSDSHSDGLLEYPQYTKPREFMGESVPEILLSGNHGEIEKWRRLQQFLTTNKKRPDLFKNFLKTELNKTDKKLLRENKHLF
ncbi:tRNA (guanosine(37)-N1)-methyltransferase TrmD [bacterium]|nr:tRNA (guanosine(37)-N1)-methyltransferase TrmD [bacterium]